HGTIYGVASADVVAREFADADDALGRSRGARCKGPVLPARAAREVFGVCLEGQVVDGDDTGAGATQGEEAVGCVDDVGADAPQRARQPELLPDELRPGSAAGQERVVDAVARGMLFQRLDEARRIAPPTTQLVRACIARVDGDRRHAARSVRLAP